MRGQDCVYHVLGLIPITGGNETRNAIADALHTKILADAPVEVTVMDNNNILFSLAGLHAGVQYSRKKQVNR